MKICTLFGTSSKEKRIANCMHYHFIRIDCYVIIATSSFMEAAMSYYEIITCRIAIQVCIGHLPNGREMHRTFSMRGINPGASLEAIAEVIRALAPVLAYPITKVRKVTKREIIFYLEAAMAVPLDIEPVTEAVAEARRVIIPFRFNFAARTTAQQALSDIYRCKTVPVRTSQPRQVLCPPGRAPPGGVTISLPTRLFKTNPRRLERLGFAVNHCLLASIRINLSTYCLGIVLQVHTVPSSKWISSG